MLDMMDARTRAYIYQWALLGIVGVAVIATLWHFLFFLTGEFAVVGAIVPVNSSVWEHFKVILYPVLLFSLIEYRYIGQLAGAWVMTFDPLPKYLKYVAIVFLVFIIALAIVLIVYTYNPFHTQISLDTAARIYGLP